MNSELGPDLFALLNARQWVGDLQPAVYGKGGLSDSELDSIEAQLGFSLPSDFRYFLKNVRDEGGIFFPWDQFEKRRYDESIARVLDGILFDVEECGDWIDELGARPSSRSAAAVLVKSNFSSWPKLLPLHSHRFLPAQPCEAGNPVFSIVQTDIVYYGANLANYLMNEFIHKAGSWRLPTEIRSIPVWSGFIR